MMMAGPASTIWLTVVGGALHITIAVVPGAEVDPAMAGPMGRAWCPLMHGPP